MRINAPENYFGKKIKVIATDGQEIIGELYGYNYNYDDDGNAFVEIDVENAQGFLIGLDESEIKSIEVTEL